jgi:hypothetical protein
VSDITKDLPSPVLNSIVVLSPKALATTFSAALLFPEASVAVIESTSPFTIVFPFRLVVNCPFWSVVEETDQPF